MNEKLINKKTDIPYKAYCQFWGCEPDKIFHQTDSAVPKIDIYRFSKVKESSNLLSDMVIYISSGMSALPMPNTEEFKDNHRLAEIMTFAWEPILTESGEEDIIALICQRLAHYPFYNNTYFQCGHTYDWGGPILVDSDMEGLYFGQPPFIDLARLKAMTGHIGSYIHLIPISRGK